MRELASRICRDYLTGAWKTIAASDLHIKRIRLVRIYVDFFFEVKQILIILFVYFSGGLSNFLYYVSLPDDTDSCNNIKNIKRPRKDASPQEPKEVCIAVTNIVEIRVLHFCFVP